MFICKWTYVALVGAYFNIRSDVSDELFSADSSSSLSGLRLQLYQLGPKVFGGSSEVANLCVGV